MIPATLEQWTIPAIENLLAQGYYEPEYFDYKQMLPDPRDVNGPNGQRRLLKACCAFANSSGGFLVFGVDDDRTKPPTDRLVGIDPTVDFPEHFGNYPAKCSPTVRWDARNPPLTLSDGNKIYVVYIPRSWTAPHCFEDPSRQSSGWLSFPKRTNKGDEDMSYEEIRMSFLQYYEKRLKLQLMQSELENIKWHASTQPGSISEPAVSIRITGEFGLTVVETTLSDTFTIFASNRELLRLLANIRKVCRMLNAQLNYSIGNAALIKAEFMGDADKIMRHNSRISMYCDQIRRDCDQALVLLAEVIAS